MSYDHTIKWDDELSFSVCNIGSMLIGFNWEDDAIKKAVLNRDPRIFDILDRMIVQGHADLYNQSVEIEYEVGGYGVSDPREQFRRIDGLAKMGWLSDALSNPYVSERVKDVVSRYLSGELYKSLPPKEARPKRAKQRGYVYLLRAENGLYKIGRAKDLSERLTPFSVSFPMAWELRHSFYSHDYIQAEKNLHKQFNEKRKVGEWFDLAQEDVDFIMAIPSEAQSE